MSQRANFQKNYLMRYVIMAGICWFAAAWFAYDGFIGYPKNIPAAEAYDNIRDIKDSNERILKWKDLAEQNGWPMDVPKETAEEIRESITGQYIWMVVSLLGGIPALLYYVRCRGTWVEATDAGLKTSWGQNVDFSSVTQLNKKRWAAKGIARATYEEDGVPKVFIFDDFKYEREPLGKMLRRLEDMLTDEQIVGGPSERDAESAKSNASTGGAGAESEEESANSSVAT